MARSGKSSAKDVLVMVGTRKGAWWLRSDGSRRKWSLTGPSFLGHIIYHIVLDPRDGKTLLMAARTGHLGPTMYRSTNLGRSWKEVERPPAFPKAPEGEKGRVVDHVFWLTPGHASEKNVWYAGTSPQGLFRSEDGGRNWEGVSGFNDNPNRSLWMYNDQDQTPDGGKMHSICVDPRDANHMYLSMSGGGTFESTDKGASWRPFNKGVAADFSPVPDPEFGQDPHHMALHPLRPDRLYQQNHCGIYRIDRPEERWTRIGMKMPKKIGDIGFPLVLHPRDPDTLWVFPMDGTSVWPRVSPGGKPAAYRSANGGKSWERQDKGLPTEQAWFTVKRQAMCSDHGEPLGLYFGTTSGEVWASRTEGGSWQCVARHLPHIYSVTSAAIER
ncbi:MAG: glycosyl hydrolase [Candidatus Wallbacteria bacterium]|nr:glycosyl hydrolase [Candidatus Wallbacteria bacterium]